MIKYFVKAWNENKSRLEDYLRNTKQDEYSSYEELFKVVIDKVLNNYLDVKFDSNITTIDYGDYQGTLILTFANDTYQPTEDETFYTVIDYGSCSGCDTLQAICDYDYNKNPSEEQIKDYMSLCLHMIQKIRCFGDIEENYRLRDKNN